MKHTIRAARSRARRFPDGPVFNYTVPFGAMDFRNGPAPAVRAGVTAGA